MRVKILLVAVFSCLVAMAQVSNLYAGFRSGTELMVQLEDYINGSDSVDAAYAMGYIVGVFDTSDGILFHSPDDVKVKQILHVVYNHMRSNPGSWNEPGSSCVIDALSKEWPVESAQ